MTVSYQYEVASSTSGGFTRLLFMWRGSLYKLIYRELLLFIVAFGLLSAAYRNLFTEPQRRLFEKVVIYCETFIAFIPLSFVLGFYVAYVANRWWQQYLAIPWPDKVMHSLALYVTGNDTHGRMVRRTLMRYLNLSLVLVLRSISSAVKRRFPTMEHLVEAGFMTQHELEMFQAVPSIEFNTYWIPCTWFIALLKDTKTANRVVDSQGLQIIVQEFNDYRAKCGMLWSYDWISIPLVYTQVVTLATYVFFLAALVGRQYVDDSNVQRKKQFQMEIDVYIPIFTILQFFFYMGLLKVAEQLINPFGDDDEDFELNWLIDRHLKVSYLGVDTLMTRYPPLVKDKYFDESNLILPYTGAAFAYKKKTYRGSVHNMQVPESQQSMFLPEISEEDEDDMESSKRGSTPKKTSSFTNVLNAVSPAAGIWRSNSGTGQLYSGNVETSSQPSELRVDVGKFQTRAPWRSHHTPVTTPEFCGLDLWSSQSTLDSVDSSLLISVSPTQPKNLSAANSQQVKNHSENTQTVPSMKKTESMDLIESQFSSRSSVSTAKSKNGSKIFKYSSTGNIALSLKHSFSKHLKDLKSKEHTTLRAILNRRQSSSSGQWKGVRWKPVIDDSAGDIWSDNCYRRHSGELCPKCKHLTGINPSLGPSHNSSDSVTSSFHSVSDNTNLSSPPQAVYINSNNKIFNSKTILSVSEENISHGSIPREMLTASSLPNIAFSAFSSLQTEQTSDEHVHPSQNQTSLLELPIKSHSSSPHTFSKIQETIEEENEMK